MDGRSFAAEASPLISELVFSVHRRAGSDSRERLYEAEAAIGTELRGMMGDLTALLLAGLLTEADVHLRYRYAPQERVREFLDREIAGGHFTRDGNRFVASAALREGLELAEELRGASAASLWGDDEAAAAAEAIPVILAGAPITDGLLASQLRAPEWEANPHRLFQRLSRMRYMRNDSHAAAWAAHGLRAGEIVYLTAVWREQDPPDDPAAAASLAGKGLLQPAGLTPKGREVRQAIEDQTNANDAPAYERLTADERNAWIERLRGLETHPAG